MFLLIYLQSGHQIFHNLVFPKKDNKVIINLTIAYRCFLRICQVNLVFWPTTMRIVQDNY